MNQEEFQDYVVGKFKEWDKFINGNGKTDIKLKSFDNDAELDAVAGFDLVMIEN